LRQGDPISPLLFNLVIDVFTRMMGKAARKGYIQGFMTQVFPEGVISLQYANDTLIFHGHDLEAACHLKWIMVCFEQLSRMKINYHKSDLVPVNLDENETQLYAKKIVAKWDLFLSNI
jgi:hypothetical protein